MVRTAAVTLAVAVGAAGCGTDGADSGNGGGDRGGGGKAKPRFETGQAVGRADSPVRVRLTGVDPGTRVRVSARADDRYDMTWASQVVRTADKHGRVDLAKDTPRLLSGMMPLGGKQAKLKGSGKTFSYHSGPPGTQRSYKVNLTATARSGEAAGTRLTERALTRQWLTKGATYRELTVAKDKVAGDLYLPARGKDRKAPVLIFGGSEGGNAGTYTAALLASRGHPAMSVCYFRCGKGSGRPNGLDGIDLDYFTHAGRILRAQEGADPGRLTVMGNSRGSEAAQLLGQRRPSVFRDVVAYAPSSKVNGPYLSGTVAWTDRGRPVPTGPIPLDRVRGEVLAVAGGNDKMWGAAASAGAMARRGADKLVYPEAGHHVNWFPFAQPGQEGGRNGSVVATSRADQEARADSWPKILKLLDR